MKVAIYSKENCGICESAKKKMSHFGLDKADTFEGWKDGTWVERDASRVILGDTGPQWREFPDTEVLTFITYEATDKIPLVWIDGEVYHYSEAMKKMKAMKKAMDTKPLRLPQVIHDEEEICAAATA